MKTPISIRLSGAPTATTQIQLWRRGTTRPGMGREIVSERGKMDD